ncbi:MAG: universal stress protein [Nitrospira sp.]|nr:universal stress protein [Nitrospira sp.]
MKSSRLGEPFTIVVATDFSPTARHAFDTAVSWASRLEARISLLHVIKGAWSASELAAGAKVLKPLKTAALLKLGRFARLASEAGFRADVYLATGNPGERILTHCRTHQVDLLVVGAQGRSGLSRTFLGSVADELVRKAPCPVLTINPSVKGLYRGKRRRHPDD